MRTHLRPSFFRGYDGYGLRRPICFRLPKNQKNPQMVVYTNKGDKSVESINKNRLKQAKTYQRTYYPVFSL